MQTVKKHHSCACCFVYVHKWLCWLAPNLVPNKHTMCTERRFFSSGKHRSCLDLGDLLPQLVDTLADLMAGHLRIGQSTNVWRNDETTVIVWKCFKPCDDMWWKSLRQSFGTVAGQKPSPTHLGAPGLNGHRFRFDALQSGRLGKYGFLLKIDRP